MAASREMKAGCVVPWCGADCRDSGSDRDVPDRPRPKLADLTGYIVGATTTHELGGSTQFK